MENFSFVHFIALMLIRLPLAGSIVVIGIVIGFAQRQQQRN
ncbi:hypothetical protein [Tahibacter aquaticus]|nr:hypothetical protein [Tahibacter aquaticus]